MTEKKINISGQNKWPTDSPISKNLHKHGPLK